MVLSILQMKTETHMDKDVVCIYLHAFTQP